MIEKGTFMSVLLGFSVLAFVPLSLAGPYTAVKNNACPKGWEDTKKSVPVLGSSVPWHDVADKATGLTHITPRAQLETIDGVPVTAKDKVLDPLTVASECLVYRNFEVDTAAYVTPPAQPLNTSLGWLPAVVY